MFKKVWYRKCVRRVIFQKVEVKAEGGFVPLKPYFVYNTVALSFECIYIYIYIYKYNDGEAFL